MTILALTTSATPTHERLPSLPPSPTPEEDLGGAKTNAWDNRENDDDDDQENLVPSSAKLKGKQREVSEGTEGTDVGSTTEFADTEEGLTPTSVNGYPPMTVEEDESRMVEENLKRWEHDERLRRRAARESANMANTPTSIVSDIGRRASLLWRGTRASRTSRTVRNSTASAVNTDDTRVDGSFGDTVDALDAHDKEGVPLNDLERSPSPGSSKPASPLSRPVYSGLDGRLGTGIGLPVDNPFEPPDSASPLHPDAMSAMMDGSSIPPTPAATNTLRGPPLENDVVEAGAGSDRPILQAISSFSRPPPPLPFDLPPPRTPPPRIDTPGVGMAVKRPPGPISPPRQSAGQTLMGKGQRGDVEEEGVHRWWTDWLCGCREGPNRGGDNQAGRTNPFE